MIKELEKENNKKNNNLNFNFKNEIIKTLEKENLRKFIINKSLEDFFNNNFSYIFVIKTDLNFIKQKIKQYKDKILEQIISFQKLKHDKLYKTEWNNKKWKYKKQIISILGEYITWWAAKNFIKKYNKNFIINWQKYFNKKDIYDIEIKYWKQLFKVDTKTLLAEKTNINILKEKRKKPIQILEKQVLKNLNDKELENNKKIYNFVVFEAKDIDFFVDLDNKKIQVLWNKDKEINLLVILNSRLNLDYIIKKEKNRSDFFKNVISYKIPLKEIFEYNIKFIIENKEIKKIFAKKTFLEKIKKEI